MDYPTYVIVNNHRYDIDTNFKTAIECNQIAQDETIGDFERMLAVLYKLFGEKAIKCTDDYEKLLKMAIKYLSCNKEIEDTNKEPDMDYIEDYDYIEASFMSDFHIDLSTENMHWWKFYKLLNGLSNSEMGNCCVLNRVRNLRNIDLRTIQDSKEREKIRVLQKEVALKKYDKRYNLTQEQEESIKRLDEIINKKR